MSTHDLTGEDGRYRCEPCGITVITQRRADRERDDTDADAESDADRARPGQ